MVNMMDNEKEYLDGLLAELAALDELLERKDADLAHAAREQARLCEEMDHMFGEGDSL